MSKVFAVYGVVLVLMHVVFQLASYEPFATATAGDRVPPSQIGPNGPVIVPMGFHGGK